MELINGDTQVKITLSGAANGTHQKLRYAYTCPGVTGVGLGGYGRCGDPTSGLFMGGNLRDSDNSISPAADST